MKAIDLENIRKVLEGFKANISDLANDRTESAAQESLAAAESAVAKLQEDDHRKTPEQLVDERFEAERAVSIARLRLTRAKSEAITRRARASNALNEPAEKVADSLRENAPLIQAKLIADLKSILGEDFPTLKGQLENLAYHRAERMHAAARNIEKAKGTANHAGFILAALPLMESDR